MGARAWLAIGIEFFVFAGILFGSAGTLRWPAAWAFLVLFFSSAVAITSQLARSDPALLNERLRPLIQKGQPRWDKALMSTIAVLFIGWLVLMGLDAVRFGWSAMPLWLQAIGAAGVGLTMWISWRIFRENTFAAAVVKIQSDRGQRVISTGPYRIVRHPLYAGALPFFPSTALLLGSWYGVAGSIPLMAGLVLRTALEDRELRRRLDGYQGYAERVRYRLIPFIW